jgi:hypothetical protein
MQGGHLARPAYSLGIVGLDRISYRNKKIEIHS